MSSSPPWYSGQPPCSRLMRAQIDRDLRLQRRRRSRRGSASSGCIRPEWCSPPRARTASSRRRSAAPISASRARAMARSRSVETVLVSGRARRHRARARSAAPACGDGFPAMRLMCRSSLRSGGAPAPPHGPLQSIDRAAEVDLRDRLGRLRPTHLGKPGAAAARARRGRTAPQQPVVAHREVREKPRHGHRRARDLHLGAGGESGMSDEFCAMSAPPARWPTDRSAGCRSPQAGSTA